jgi:CRP-like cAMP-binding protein
LGVRHRLPLIIQDAPPDHSPRSEFQGEIRHVLLASHIRLQEQARSLQKVEVEIGLSGEGLAQMTGTTLYTVNRLLSAWEAHGLMNSRRESLMIRDVWALRQVCEEN